MYSGFLLLNILLFRVDWATSFSSIRSKQLSTHHLLHSAVTNDAASQEEEFLSSAFDDIPDRMPSGGPNHRCGFCCIIGAPNMGKSSLLNTLLQEELCVATRRPQTTRHAILGVISEEDVQLCLTDTPGVIEDPAYKLQEGMMEAVMGAYHDADMLLVVTDLFSTPIPDDDLFQRLQQETRPIVVAINKIDLQDKVKNMDDDDNGERTVTVEQAVVKWRNLLPQSTVILPLSATDGNDSPGVVALRRLLLGGPDVPAALRELGRPLVGMFRDESVKTITDEEAIALLPLSPPLYHQDALSDRSERFFASEIVRAAIFTKLKKEVPYCCEVRVKSFREPREADKKKLIRLTADVIVERESQKGIVVGQGGETVKSIGIEAREKLEEFFQDQVFLELFVKVEKDWRKNEAILKQYGYMK